MTYFRNTIKSISKGTTLKLHWRNMAGWRISILVWDNVSCSPDWPMQPEMSELLTLLLGLQMWTTTPYLRPEHLELKFGCKTNLLNQFSLLFFSTFFSTNNTVMKSPFRYNKNPEWTYLYMNELTCTCNHFPSKSCFLIQNHPFEQQKKHTAFLASSERSGWILTSFLHCIWRHLWACVVE